MPSTTLIVGGGTGGIVAASTLRGLLPSNHRVVLLERQPDFHMGATKTWVMLGERTRQQVSARLDSLKRRGVDVMRTQVLRIDPAARSVRTRDGQLKGDFLVIALGADYRMEAVEGLARAAETFYTLDGAERLRPRLREFEGGDVVILIPRGPFKCPPAPYEGAFLLHHFFNLRGIGARTRIAVHTFEGAPMATAGPEVGGFIRDELQKRGIGCHPLQRTKSVDPARRTVLFEDGSEAKFDLLIAVPPHAAPEAVRDSGLTNQSGWIPADPKTLQMPGSEGCFAIGDVSVVPLPGRFKPDSPLVLPKAGVFATSQGRVVAGQIAARVLGRDPQDAFDGRGFCYVEMGDRHAMKGEGSFFDLPSPTMRKRVPDMTQLEEKHRWVQDWMRTYLA